MLSFPADTVALCMTSNGSQPCQEKKALNRPRAVIHAVGHGWSGCSARLNGLGSALHRWECRFLRVRIGGKLLVKLF